VIAEKENRMLELQTIEPAVRIQSREDIIGWLEWNDPNGCYSDEANDLEFLPRMTLETALSLYFQQAGE